MWKPTKSPSQEGSTAKAGAARTSPLSSCCGRELVEERARRLRFAYCKTCPHAIAAKLDAAETARQPNSTAINQRIDQLESWSTLLPPIPPVSSKS